MSITHGKKKTNTTPLIIKKGSAALCQLPTQKTVIKLITKNVKYDAEFTLCRVCFFATTKKYGTKAIKSKRVKGKGNGTNEIPKRIPDNIKRSISFLLSFFSSGVKSCLANKNFKVYFFFL